MKKSIAVLMLGSALLLSNNNSVEASYSDKEVQVQKAQYIQNVEFGVKNLNIYDLKSVKGIFEGYRFDLMKSLVEFEKFIALSKQAPSTPEAKPAPTKPVPSTPEAKPAPTKPVPSTPEAKPAPTKPVPSTPEVKPAPTKPVPTTPEVQPAPTAPVQPTPEVKPAPTTPAEPAQNASVSAIEKEVLDLTNVERQKAGLAPLQTDSKLMNSARQKSTDMATNKYFSHTSPTYGSPFDQMKANGVTYKSAAENIAMGQRTAQEVVKGWMESPGHRQNILTAGYTHIGIGYDANGHYWTQQFIGK